MINEPREQELNDALGRLRGAIEVPPVDPAREQALLAAFDAHWARPRTSPARWLRLTAVAALMVMTLALDRFVVTRAPQVGGPAGPIPSADLTGFVAWPGAEARPPFESGTLIRVDLPVSSLPALGLPPPSPSVNVVQADIVVGQDGFARAVRLVQ